MKLRQAGYSDGRAGAAAEAQICTYLVISGEQAVKCEQHLSTASEAKEGDNSQGPLRAADRAAGRRAWRSEAGRRGGCWKHVCELATKFVIDARSCCE